jgi:hypothetical protein
MPLLKVKVERKGTKRNIGGYFPTYIDSYLTLKSLAEAVTKSSIMQSILEKWVANSRAKESEKVLLDRIIQRLSAQWKIDKKQPPYWSFEEYKEKVHVELLSRGISEENVDKILKAIQK